MTVTTHARTGPSTASALPAAAFIHHASLARDDADALAEACARLAPHCALTLVPVEAGESLSEVARRAVSAGAELLIAAGGDGTVSAVAAAAVGRDDVRLGILPFGTSNSFANHLGIGADLQRACEVIARGETRTVDTARCNGRPMVLMATIGIHADAITLVDPARKRRYGVLAYVIEEASRLLEDSRFEVTVELGGQRATVSTSALTVANVARPEALFVHGACELADDDGLLDVTLVAIDGVSEALATSLHLATAVLTNTTAHRPNVVSFRTSRIQISTREPRRVMVDGEDAFDTPVRVEVVPNSLRVCAPPAADEGGTASPRD